MTHVKAVVNIRVEIAALVWRQPLWAKAVVEDTRIGALCRIGKGHERIVTIGATTNGPNCRTVRNANGNITVRGGSGTSGSSGPAMPVEPFEAAKMTGASGVGSGVGGGS